MNKILRIVTLVFVFSFLINASDLYSQQLKISYQTGIGIYNLKHLKSISELNLEGLPFEAKLLSNYPPFLYHKPIIAINFDYFDLGFYTGFYATGSRISSRDYSGEYRFDNRLKCISPGIRFDTWVYQTSQYEGLYISLESGINFSKYLYSEFLILDNEEIFNNSDTFKSMQLYFEPSIKYRKSLSIHLEIDLFASYSLSLLGNALHNENNMGVKYENDFVLPEWRGFRIGTELSYVF